jgi:hypothetical protein
MSTFMTVDIPSASHRPAGKIAVTAKAGKQIQQEFRQTSMSHAWNLFGNM